MIRAVCDTSVLVPETTRTALHGAATDGLFQPVWSPWIIGELYRVLTWKWARTHGVSETERRRCSDAANAMMELMLDVWRLVDVARPWPPTWPALGDRWDVPIWATAVASGAPYVVSDNRHDFPPANPQGRHIWQGVEYLPARVFLSDILHRPLSP